MNKKLRALTLAAVLLLTLAASLFSGIVAYAEGEEAFIEVFRLTKTHVELKITLPGGFDVNANYGGMLTHKYFNCEAISTDVLICIGPYPTGSDPALFTVYDKTTKEIVLQQVISAPPLGGEDDGDNASPICNPELEECASPQ